MLAAWALLKKPDLSMILNGCLAGLVGITAPCAFISIANGALAGLVAGVEDKLYLYLVPEPLGPSLCP